MIAISLRFVAAITAFVSTTQGWCKAPPLMRWTPVGSWSLLVNARLGNRDRDASDFENGFSENIRAFDFGLDYRINNQWVIGGLATFENADTDFEGQAGELNADNRSLTALVSGALGNGWKSVARFPVKKQRPRMSKLSMRPTRIHRRSRVTPGGFSRQSGVMFRIVHL